MNNKITIQSPPSGRDSTGQSVKVWNNVRTVWASKDSLIGKEFYAANQTQNSVEVKFRTYFYSGMNNAMRIVHGNNTYEVINVSDPDDLKKELLWYCKKVKK
ncbi:phage head closure protein [Bacillus sp. UNCCL81]|uniref:phage head closure protein n=1 Tax=Bacillus sp. UNCCL81 TaxID=1502755 RepID=UPI0008E9EB5C|nr:phage head closure protein [Bacillus sp. UNCCL81]SFD44117.1 phage head-tail adaptor, putative, SPP1 family [Bacillus sp. UNCCL81]